MASVSILFRVCVLFCEDEGAHGAGVEQLGFMFGLLSCFLIFGNFVGIEDGEDQKIPRNWCCYLQFYSVFEILLRVVDMVLWKKEELLDLKGASVPRVDTVDTDWNDKFVKSKSFSEALVEDERPIHHDYKDLGFDFDAVVVAETPLLELSKSEASIVKCRIEDFIQNLALFFTSFYKSHIRVLESTSENITALLMGLEYLIGSHMWMTRRSLRSILDEYFEGRCLSQLHVVEGGNHSDQEEAEQGAIQVNYMLTPGVSSSPTQLHFQVSCLAFYLCSMEFCSELMTAPLCI
ncbi:hypothetical protein Droror1_Dr00023541 [Drosera rotundifolia]